MQNILSIRVWLHTSIVSNRLTFTKVKFQNMNGKRTTHKLKTLARFSKPNTIWPAIDSISTKRNYLRRDIKCLKVAHKVAYISAIAILVTVLGTQVNRCAIHFWSSPTYFATTFVPQQKALFPSLTICPVTAGYKKNILQVRSNIHLYSQYKFYRE